MRRVLTRLVLMLVPLGASAADLPQVVSINVCTDQLVLLLADPGQILSLSHLSDDPRASVMADMAAGFPKNNSEAEMIALQKPDVVVAGEYSNPGLIGLMRGVGISVVQFPVTRSLADISDDIRLMGSVLSQEARADALATAFERDLAERGSAAADAPLAAFFFPNGYTLGTGTLSHDILTKSGLRNLSVELGFEGNSNLSLEQVVLTPPDLLLGAQPFDGFSWSEETALHPALSGIPKLHTSVEWVCGTPHVLNAIDSLAEAGARLGTRNSE